MNGLTLGFHPDIKLEPHLLTQDLTVRVKGFLHLHGYNGYVLLLDNIDYIHVGHYIIVSFCFICTRDVRVMLKVQVGFFVNFTSPPNYLQYISR